MWTILFWKPKQELRVVATSLLTDGGQTPRERSLLREMELLPEHVARPPQFATVEESWQFIRQHYPHLQP